MRTRRTWSRRFCVATLAAAAPLQLLAVVGDHGDPVDRPDAPVAVQAPAVVSPPDPRTVPLAPVEAELAPSPAAPPASPPSPVQLVTEPEVVPTPAAPVARPAPRAETFADRFPAQAAAVQDPSDPATTRWALLIGINEHRGSRIADNIGSRQDAEDLRAHLLANGWRDDHILLLTDRRATRADIVAGIAWLAEKTDQSSVAVLHYSGHSKKWYGRDVDGDGEVTDEGLWPSDHGFIPDSELVRLLDPVRPQALWLSFATCNAAGLADPGMARPGRILTFSSGEPQKSYENPAWGNSVWGWFLFEQAIAAGHGDLDHDGRVTVEEAFVWARPQAAETTRYQSHGRQDGVIVDQAAGDFDLLVPGAPRPAPTSASEQAPDGQAPQDPQPAPQQPQPTPDRRQPQQPEPTEEDHGNRICILCGG